MATSEYMDSVPTMPLSDINTPLSNSPLIQAVHKRSRLKLSTDRRNPKGEDFSDGKYTRSASSQLLIIQYFFEYNFLL